LWFFANGDEVISLSGHKAPVVTLAFSPDSHILATGSADHTVRLWDTRNSSLLSEMTGHTGWVRCMAFSPDGKTLASGSEDGTITFWDIHSGESIRNIRQPRPYEGMNITGTTGLTEAQRETLKALGAVEEA
jgi:WD40 repeat protein